MATKVLICHLLGLGLSILLGSPSRPTHHLGAKSPTIEAQAVLCMGSMIFGAREMKRQALLRMTLEGFVLSSPSSWPFGLKFLVGKVELPMPRWDEESF